VLLSTLSLKVCSICNIIHIYISKYIIQFLLIFQIFIHIAFWPFCISIHMTLRIIWSDVISIVITLSCPTQPEFLIILISITSKYLYYIDRKRKRVVIDSKASIKIFLMTKPTTPYHSTPYHIA
jgi:hypothetical protein